MYNLKESQNCTKQQSLNYVQNEGVSEVYKNWSLEYVQNELDNSSRF